MNFPHGLKNIFQSGYRFGDGSRLIPDGRDGRIYVTKDGHKVAFQCELWDAASGTERCIYASTIQRWMSPHETEPFTDGDRQEVIRKTTEFFRKTNTTYIVQ